MIAPHERHGKQISQTAMSVLGLILMAVPLALWVAWSQFVFVAILLVAAIAIALVGVLANVSRPRLESVFKLPQPQRRTLLPDEFIEEVQRLHPMIHHHTPSGSARFRRAMERLLRLLDGREG